MHLLAACGARKLSQATSIHRELVPGCHLRKKDVSGASTKKNKKRKSESTENIIIFIIGAANGKNISTM